MRTNSTFSRMIGTALAMLLILAGSFSASAQGKLTVTGKVIDELNSPMVGVSVIEKGTQNGVMTDGNGKYTISVNPGAVVEFSYLGYITVDKNAIDGTININMEPDNELLEETVVVGYGVQKKSSLTGSVSQVKSEDISGRTITTASQALQGKTAGVQILTSSAKPGASPAIRVRGIGSNGASDPLVVVDGRIGSLAGIDPNDIESMEVLKDGASAAIYGAEAGNGVILVTTRKGKGNGKITYDYQYTNQSLARVPKVMNSEQYIDYYTELGSISLESFYNNWDFETNTDWTKVGFENSTMQRHNLTFSAGDMNKSIYISGSYLNNDGIVTGGKDFYERLTGMINASWKIKPWLEIGTNNQIEHYKSSSVSEGSEYGSFLLSLLCLDPLTKPYYSVDALPSHMASTYYDTSHAPMLGDGKGNIYGVSYFTSSSECSNPFIARDASDNTGKGYNINGTTYINFMPIKGLTITSRLGYSLSSSQSYSVAHDYYASSKSKQDFLSVSASTYASTYWQWENFLNYNKSIKGHDFGIMLGTSFTESRNFGVSGSMSGGEGDLGFLHDDPLHRYFAYATPTANDEVSGGEETISRKNSYFGRLNYEYKGRYLLQASLRADAADSSVLPIETRWGYFPAVSAGWVISNEKFMMNTRSWLSHLKFRASWGQNGSLSNLGGYLYDTVIAQTGTLATGNGSEYIIGYAPSATGNKELKWETSEQTNVGIDARFLNNRLSFGADWFLKNTKDLIVRGIKSSTIVGNTASPMNVGNIMNTGLEFELGWQDHIGDFSYGIRGNLSTIRNKVTKIHETMDSIDGTTLHTYGAITRFEVGRPAWYFYGYEYTGIDKTTGNPTFKDRNGDNAITDDDKTMIGKGIADLTYGITLTAAWKGFDLIVFGTGSYGADIYCCLNRLDYPLNKLTYFTADRWNATKNPTGEMPRVGASDMDKFLISSGSVFDGSYFKIKQIQLGYTFPQKWMKKIKVENLRIYASLDDFITFSDYPGFDPEVTAMGIDKGTFPTSKKVVAGVSITF
ncbi:MAG: TonB-dependent receptor [Bacteroidales bacterium]|nr:TonB-dependent receptor [Bacteroidales bacterium]